MLTQFVLTNAKPREKDHKLSDGDGLYLLVKTSGSKLWRQKYRFAGKEKTLSHGSFPEVGAAEAREKCRDARKVLARGEDPGEHKKVARIDAATAAANTFSAIAKERLKKSEDEGASPATVTKNKWLLEDLASPLANRPITEIKPAEILMLLQKIERSGRRETAHRLREVIGSVFRLAIVTLRAETDPTAPLKGALLKPQVTPRPAIIEEKALGALWANLADYDGWPTLKAAIQFLALTMTRPIETRLMQRPEVDLRKAVWKIPAERMKMRLPHEVPLSRQALAVLEGVWDLSRGDLVFPSIRSTLRPLSENAMNSALRRMGYTKDEMTAHGFRASASSILNEWGFDPDVIEAALAHQDEDEVRRVYNRAKYWNQRVQLMQSWADLLDEFQGLRPRLRVVA